jgi:hypothetical protein
MQRYPNMTNTELAALATTIAAAHTTTITRRGDTFTYTPDVKVRNENDFLGRHMCTYVIVSVPVNAVLKKDAALAMINAFRRDLVNATIGTRITCKMTKARNGGRTPVHAHTFTHMGHTSVEGYWISFSAE